MLLPFALALVVCCPLSAHVGSAEVCELSQPSQPEPANPPHTSEPEPSEASHQEYQLCATPQTALVSLLQQLCALAGLNLCTKISPAERAPFTMMRGSIRSILDALCTEQYTWQIKDGTLYLSSALSTEVYVVSIPAAQRAVWEEVRQTVKTIYTDCAINQKSGLVVATGLAAQHARMCNYLKVLVGAADAQVCISVTVIHVVRSDKQGGGIDINNLWTRLADRTALSLSGDGLILKVGAAGEGGICKVFQEYGRITSASTALISATNNQPARLQVNKRLVYFKHSHRALKAKSAVSMTQVANENAGTFLEICPTIKPDGVLLGVNFRILSHTDDKVNPVMLALGNESKHASAFLEGSKIPVIDTQSIGTNVLLQAGEGVLLGGLLVSKKKRSGRGIPILSRIPWLGGLFGEARVSEEKEEVYIYIRILDRFEARQGVRHETKQRLRVKQSGRVAQPGHHAPRKLG